MSLVDLAPVPRKKIRRVKTDTKLTTPPPSPEAGGSREPIPSDVSKAPTRLDLAQAEAQHIAERTGQGALWGGVAGGVIAAGAIMATIATGGTALPALAALGGESAITAIVGSAASGAQFGAGWGAAAGTAGAIAEQAAYTEGDAGSAEKAQQIGKTVESAIDTAGFLYGGVQAARGLGKATGLLAEEGVAVGNVTKRTPKGNIKGRSKKPSLKTIPEMDESLRAIEEYETGMTVKQGKEPIPLPGMRRNMKRGYYEPTLSRRVQEGMERLEPIKRNINRKMNETVMNTGRVLESNAAYIGRLTKKSWTTASREFVGDSIEMTLRRTGRAMQGKPQGPLRWGENPPPNIERWNPRRQPNARASSSNTPQEFGRETGTGRLTEMLYQPPKMSWMDEPLFGTNTSPSAKSMRDQILPAENTLESTIAKIEESPKLKASETELNVAPIKDVIMKDVPPKKGISPIQDVVMKDAKPKKGGNATKDVVMKDAKPKTGGNAKKRSSNIISQGTSFEGEVPSIGGKAKDVVMEDVKAKKGGNATKDVVMVTSPATDTPMTDSSQAIYKVKDVYSKEVIMNDAPAMTLKKGASLKKDSIPIEKEQVINIEDLPVINPTIKDVVRKEFLTIRKPLRQIESEAPQRMVRKRTYSGRTVLDGNPMSNRLLTNNNPITIERTVKWRRGNRPATIDTSQGTSSNRAMRGSSSSGSSGEYVEAMDPFLFKLNALKDKILNMQRLLRSQNTSYREANEIRLKLKKAREALKYLSTLNNYK